MGNIIPVQNRIISIFIFVLASCSPEPSSTIPVQETIFPKTATVTKQIIIPTYTEELSSQVHPLDTPTIEITKTIVKQTATAPQPEFTQTADMRLKPYQWGGWPIIPTLSQHAKDIYWQGIDNGNHPQHFSTIGDCQGMPEIFMGLYETERNPLALPKDAPLIETVDFFNGSFNRQGFAVSNGLSAPSALSPLWANPEFCEPKENPVECELRIHKPAIAFIILGTNWSSDSYSQKYYDYLQQIVDILVVNGTLPILATKADNVEGDHSINLITAKIAFENDLPLWNFWLAADTLTNHGLDANQKNIYLSPAGWNRLSYTGLQVLDSIHRELESEPNH
ncbi:MAG: hypothetical protein JEZ06_08390 [Anaerolineaceae bacterium]|nr:hypothetical protein [Anaerolineaceae bacterium]